MKPIAITVVCLVALFLASCGADKYMKRGEKELALGEYFDAAADFKQAYQKTPPKERQAIDNASVLPAKCLALF